LGDEVQPILRETARPTPESGSRILYIDDDAALQVAFARSLSARGFRVDAASHPREALRLAARSTYPVIVSELQLPDCDGLALIAELRALQPQASFVLASESTSDLLAPNPQLASIACLLRKPWDDAELQQVVSSAYELHRQELEKGPPESAEELWSVLLVEDDKRDASKITGFLKQCGACGDVAHCSRLSSALALLHSQTFDLVIADLALPEAPGEAALRQLRDAAPDAALIALCSSEADPGQLAGTQEQLVKGSFDRDSLRRHLQSALAEKRLERGF
jgi:CheY-like chemotaxis protein